LLRVHGSLLWSLGKIITTPEVPRVYVGSFWNQKNLQSENLDLIQREERDLLDELIHLPSNTMIRKINLIARRCRQVRVHSLITSYLKEHSSSLFWFHSETQKHEMIEHLEHIFHEIIHTYPNLITFADFPEVQTFQKQLETVDWSTFHQLKQQSHSHDSWILIDHVNELLEKDLSDLIHEVRYSSQTETAIGIGIGTEVKEEIVSSPLMEPVTATGESLNVAHHEEKQHKPFAHAPEQRRGKFHGKALLLPSSSPPSSCPLPSPLLKEVDRNHETK
jgi:hypothetical protein